MIGIIGPADDEIQAFIDLMNVEKVVKKASLEIHIGTFNEIPVCALFCGVGKVNSAIATQLIISEFDVKQVVLTGVAGSLSEKVNINDIVVAERVAHHDLDKCVITEYHPYTESEFFISDQRVLSKLKKLHQTNKRFHSGVIVSGEPFVTDKNRDAIIESFAPLCVDMESSAIAHTCYVNDIPFTIVRSITDFADENAEETFEGNMEDASLAAIEITKEVVGIIDSIN